VIKIKIDHTKCTGCRLCEMACSLKHHDDTFQPTKSRIRVFFYENLYFPIIVGSVVETACEPQLIQVADGHEYDGCVFCRANCPVKPFFKDPDMGKPLSCDLCLQCVDVCINGALVLAREDQNEQQEKTGS